MVCGRYGAYIEDRTDEVCSEDVHVDVPSQVVLAVKMTNTAVVLQ